MPSSTIHVHLLVLLIAFQFRSYPCFSTEFMETSHEFMTTQSSVAKVKLILPLLLIATIIVYFALCVKGFDQPAIYTIYFIIFRFIYFVLCAFLPSYRYVQCIRGVQKKSIRCPRTRVVDGFKPPCGWWDQQPDHLQKLQQVSLTAKSPLQPLYNLLCSHSKSSKWGLLFHT